MASSSASRAASSSSTPPRKDYVYVPETTPYSGEPQEVFDYHSLDGKDPVICIYNGVYHCVVAAC